MAKTPIKDLFSILSWIILGALIAWGYQAATAKQADKSSVARASFDQRKAAVKASIAAGPSTTVWQTAEGEVVELYVPSSALGGLRVQVKRCIIWNGNNALAPAMSCGADPEDRDYSPPDGPDYSDLR